MPPMNSTGMKTAASDSVIETIVKRDFLRAAERRRHRVLAVLHVPHDVLEHDDRVVDDEADRERERHQRQVVEAVAEQLHRRERADDRRRQREARDDRRRDVAQEQEDHEHDEHDGQQQRELDVVHRLANRLRAVAADGERQRRRQLRLELRQQRADRVDDLDGVRAGLALDGEVDRARVVVPARRLVVLDAVVDVARPRRAGPAGRRDRRRRAAGSRGVGQLAVGLDGERAVRAEERAGRPVDAAAADRRRRPRRCRGCARPAAADRRRSRTANFCAPKIRPARRP